MKVFSVVLSVTGYLGMLAGFLLFLFVAYDRVIVAATPPEVGAELVEEFIGAFVVFGIGLLIFAAGRAFAPAVVKRPVKSAVFERDEQWFTRRTLTLEEGPFRDKAAAKLSLERPILTEDLKRRDASLAPEAMHTTPDA